MHHPIFKSLVLSDFDAAALILEAIDCEVCQAVRNYTRWARQ
jgi:hypothetical protein